MIQCCSCKQTKTVAYLSVIKEVHICLECAGIIERKMAIVNAKSFYDELHRNNTIWEEGYKGA